MSGKSQTSKIKSAVISLDTGTTEFMKWLTPKNERSEKGLIAVRDFKDNKYVTLFDKSIADYVIVKYTDCIPWCIFCDADDCGHVGFAICLKQYFDRNGNVIF